MAWFAFLLMVAGLPDAPAPIHHWRLTADHVKGQSITPLAGKLPGTLVGPANFSDDAPKALLFDGDSKAKHCITITNKIADANLPKQDITAEAWVRVDKTLQWGSIVGAFQHNGPYQKGWLLGYQHSQFTFAVASGKKTTLTYLKPKTHLQPGYWYHVVGTYDGKTQRIYINGKLQGEATEQAGPIAYPGRLFYTIGAYRDDDEHFTLTGRIDEVRVYDKALSAEQVAKRFSARKGEFPEMDAKPPEVADWPTFLRDNLRTGIAAETMKLPLHKAWEHRPLLPPSPAWPEEAKNDYWHNKYDMEERVTYDRAAQIIGAGDRVYFGSSSEDAVFCLDAATGKAVWSFVTEGPVRVAPTLIASGGEPRLLFGSDDGHVYCVAAKDGALRWKRLLAPSPRRIPGNGRVISAWPVRTDVFVEGEKAYVCAGVFPSQGVYQYTLNVADGAVLNRKTITITAQGYQQRMFGKLMIGTGRNPQGAFVGDLKSQGRDIDREANTLAKEYPYAFIGAGDVRFAGGNGKIAAFDRDTGKKLWDAKVEGRAFGLAVIRGRLFASTDTGAIYCFDGVARQKSSLVHAPAAIMKDNPKEIMLTTLGTKRKGYALILGAGIEGMDKAKFYARQTDLQIIVRDPDEDRCRTARSQVSAMGATGRIFVHHGGFDPLPYTDYLFNLVLTEAAYEDRTFAGPHAEAIRVTRPHGGVAVLGPGEKNTHRIGPLVGEGEWTHQYGDVGNTACSRDERLSGELQLQWFGKPGPKEMIDRHHRTAAPLSKNGRLFVPGEDRVIAVDAYNGAILWDRAFPDSRRVVVFRDSSYLALDADALYLASKNKVQVIDPESGVTGSTFTLPGELGDKEWGFLARPGNVLLGGAQKPGSSRRLQSAVIDRTETYYDFVPLVCSEALFALSPTTGKPLWTHRAGGLIPNMAIAADADSVYFLECRDPKSLTRSPSRAKLKDLVLEGMDAVCLDLANGRERWRREVNLSKLHHIVYATLGGGNLVFSGSRNGSADKKTGKVWYDLHVLDAKTGKDKWSNTQNQNIAIGGDHGEQDQHPVIIGNKLYQEPFAYDLDTGSRLEWNWPWTNKRRTGCGNLTAGANQLFFRNETTSMFDLTTGEAKKVTTETRPGCWINLLPVGGLLLAPEASSGCSCNFSVQTSLALIPVKKK